MISLIKSGSYRLIETKADTKILFLDTAEFAWVNVEGIGEILVVSHKNHQSDAVLSMGEYRLYSVVDEPGITDLEHLELEVGNNQWQSYMLPTGFPDDVKKRSRIIPTKKSITNNPEFKIHTKGGGKKSGS